MESPLPPGQSPDSIAWYALEHLEVCEVLQVTPEVGLSEAEAARRHDEFGSNEVLTAHPKSLLWRIPDQIVGPLVLLLMACSLASFLLNRLLEGVILLLVTILNFLPGL